jgi:sulfur transfer protein SufE
MSYPKYEKADDHSIRVIVEVPDVISLNKLLENEKMIVKKIEELQNKLNYIREVIEEAKKLNIVPEVKEDKTNFVSED